MDNEASPRGYAYHDACPSHAHDYLLPAVLRILNGLPGRPRRLFEVGCGNGYMASHLGALGFEVTGVDPSADGIRHARAAFPQLALEQGSAYDDLAAQYGRFPVVLSLEVVEHVFFPRRYAATLFELTEPGGLPSSQPPITAISRTSSWRPAGKWMRTSRRCGITGISSSGPSRRFPCCCMRPASGICALSGSGVSRRSPSP